MKRRFSRRARPSRPIKRRKYVRKSGRFGKRARFSRRGTPYLRVRRTCYLGQFTPGTASTAGFWQYRTVSLAKGFFDSTGASMGGLSNLSEYTPLFDLYKLKAFKITLRPKFVALNTGQINATTSAVKDLPYVGIKIDPSDTAVASGTYSPATLNSFLEQTGVRIRRADRPINIYVKPKVTDTYGGGGALRYVYPTWTDLSTPAGQDVAHRGYWLYFWNQNFNNTDFLPYDVFITYYLQFKGAK